MVSLKSIINSGLSFLMGVFFIMLGQYVIPELIEIMNAISPQTDLYMIFYGGYVIIGLALVLVIPSLIIYQDYQK